MESIVLASGSLRRQDYFKMLGLPFKVRAPLVDETVIGNLKASDFALTMAQKKIEKIIENLNGKLPLWIFGADTIISFEGKVFGKSSTRDDAENTLRALSGKTHEVITACALFNGRVNKIDRLYVKTEITLAELTDETLNWYLDTGEWQGAAGSYRIQGIGGCIVENIKGSYSNVVGLPLHEFYEMLLRNGYPYISE
jgi:septum formation protein